MFALGNGSGLASLKGRKLGAHVVVKLILPLHQLFPPADDLLGGEPVVRGEWDKTQMHMGIALVHVDYGGENVFNTHFLLEKFQRQLKIVVYPFFRKVS